MRCENQSVYINAGPQRAFRAPGHPQGAWALEQMMDALAAKLGMDPVEFRLKNVPTVSQSRQGNPPYTTTGLTDCLANGAKAFGWKEARRQAPASGAHPARRRRGGRHVAGRRRRPAVDGHRASCSRTAAPTSTWARATSAAARRPWGAQIVSEELGVPLDRISVEHADTGTTQFATPSGGSKTVPTESPAIRAAALEVKQQIAARMAAEHDLKLPAADCRSRGAKSCRRAIRPRRSPLGQIQAFGRRGLLVGVGYRGRTRPARRSHPFAVHFAEVEVNTKTGEVKVLRFLAAHDSGRIMNAQDVRRTRCSAASRWASGSALTEDRVMDDGQLGKLLTANLHDYKLPTALDAPADKSVPADRPARHRVQHDRREGRRRTGDDSDGAAVANAVFTRPACG